MEQKQCIKSCTPAELRAALGEMGEPAYRAKQIFSWLHKGVQDFGQMSNLSKTCRAALETRFFVSWPRIMRKQVSQKDGTVKYLLGLDDGNCIETVLMRYAHGYSLCLSTQAGCKMGCVFCASFDPAQCRNLRAGEMLDQILLVQADHGVQISNLVLMGTGEPLDNFEQVIRFLQLVSDPDGLNIGMRHISLSTCGLVPQIAQLAEHRFGLTLSVSLHAPNDRLRDALMPINRRYPIAQLMEACRAYFAKTGRRISFEYAMIGGKNDSEACANELAALLRGFSCHVNLIPLNAVPGSPLQPSTRKAVQQFQQCLQRHHVNATVRRSLGGDIAAACGQLRRSDLKNEG